MIRQGGKVEAIVVDELRLSDLARRYGLVRSIFTRRAGLRETLPRKAFGYCSRY